MNIIIDGPPRELKVNGAFYPIDADFRNCLAITQACEDPGLTSLEKRELIVRLLYDDMPDDFTEACEVAVKFLNCDERFKSEDGIRIFSMTHDAPFIRSAIQGKRGLDIDEIDFWHWWDFYYFFFDLKDTFLNQLMGVRYRIQTNAATKDDREYARKNPCIVKFPQDDVEIDDAENDEFMRRYKAAKERQGR